MIKMLIIQYKVILDVDLIVEALLARPNSFNEFGFIIRHGLVEIDLLEHSSLRGLVTGSRDSDMLAKLDLSILYWAIDLETKATLKVLGTIELNVVQRFGVVAHTISILVNTRGNTESVRSFKTIRAMHTVEIVGDPDTVKRERELISNHNELTRIRSRIICFIWQDPTYR